jgi:hypothetical protein
MNANQQALWQRIVGHELDDPRAACPFTLRLAKENNWPPGFTQRALEEYRRFVFLAMVAGHPVSPSDAVDQVWHLHLLYTQDYWDEFCGKVLQQPFHHGPSRGGADESAKFTDWYAQTLASYRRFFGEPPAEVWPKVPSHPAAVRVDPATHWIVRKPSRLWARRAAVSANDSAEPAAPTALPAKFGATLGALLVGAWLALPTSARAASGGGYGWPFDLRGPDFLVFFFVFGAVVFAVAAVMRLRLRLPEGPGAENDLTG